MAKHIAHLFIRDPLVVFSERVDQDDEDSMDHFENIQSTNWQTIRFKPPPPNSPIAWRVEFRSMEVQLTDFENASFSIFIVLLTRAILSFDLDFYMPISEVDENMKRAQKRDASRQEKFFFRKSVFPSGWSIAPHDLRSRPSSPTRTTNGSGLNGHPLRKQSSASEVDEASRCSSPEGERDEDDGRVAAEMTMNEIINGKDASFPGLLGVVNAYLNSLNVDVNTKCELRRHLDLIKHRASGELQRCTGFAFRG